VYGPKKSTDIADVIAVVHDVSNKITRNRLNRRILAVLDTFQTENVILVLNKVSTFVISLLVFGLSPVKIGLLTRLFSLTVTLSGRCFENQRQAIGNHWDPNRGNNSWETDSSGVTQNSQEVNH